MHSCIAMLSNHIILIQLLIVLWTVPTVVLSSPVPAQDQVFQYKLLKDVRANQWLTFVPLNHKQREDLLTRVESMLMVSDVVFMISIGEKLLTVFVGFTQH
ncbi:expressed protein [Batrachochytrium dendrobatidis JAM81]|uniref:Expressed protein n=1 Tax=Batrachochytrium dendrobatidis (strain JAM81 / FGSC 10211) TaxID=684364 RepID=F4NWK6_BATDJ|nr:uncharacterized protein BATDEDRAFT_36653 [Batrachochytrium dendrobatidis JAM81]EGF82499.1 expressed protein [Batrachochytrium dendrobatidis JAM81]|eukprot:XP_006676860.1 expressed protein [Batrachochytrium dendrobatidis JAM81]